MAHFTRVKDSGRKLASRSDVRVEAALGECVVDRFPETRHNTRRSARAATTSAGMACPVVRPRTVNSSQTVANREHDGAVQPPVLGLRAVQSVKTCDRASAGISQAGGDTNRSAGVGGKNIPRRELGRVRVAKTPQTAPRKGNRFESVASTGIRVLQLNMQRAAVVSGEVRSLVAEKRLDILLLQEPYVRRQGKSHTFYGLGTSFKIAAVRSERPWAAVAVANPDFEMVFVSQLSTTHCVCVEVQAPGFSFYAVSHYFQYSDDIEKHLSHLEMVLRTLRGKRVLIGTDSNARSSLWGPQATNDRGTKFERFILSLELNVVNDRSQPPTYWTTRGSSYIDVTLCSANMTRFIGEWKVRQDWTTSDHNAVELTLSVPKAEAGTQNSSTGRFNLLRADWEKFAEVLECLSKQRLEAIVIDSADRVEHLAKTLADVLTEACTQSMPRKRYFRKSNPWWTKALTIKKKAVYRLKRAYMRERDGPTRLEILHKYRSSLREYSRLARKSKRESWRNFVTSNGNENPWGPVYRLCANKFRVESVISTLRRGEYSTMDIKETASLLLDTHVPDDNPELDSVLQKEVRAGAFIAPDTPNAEPFNIVEVCLAARSMKNGKAPGTDLIEVGVLKRALSVIPGELVRLFNGCLQWGVFPSIWKEGSLRVLLKGEDKDAKDPKSYRPICLLSVIGKLFEKLLKQRLTCTAMAPGKVSSRQFGFTRRRSAEDAIVELRRIIRTSEKRYAAALLFDISGAFDNVWWPLILRSLRERDCPKNVFEVIRSYFDGRRVKISFGSIEVTKQATRGCPQGSVLGPTCWNIMFDGLLRTLEDSVGNDFAAYADDLVVVIRGDSRAELEREGNRIVPIIENWCREAKLELSSRKTEAILLRSDWVRGKPIGRRGGDRPDRKRKAARKPKLEKPPTIRIGGNKIAFKNSVKYLGVYFDKGMCVNTHCTYLSDKVESLFRNLRKAANATWGLRFGALRTVYKGVFIPTVAYAAAGWSDLCTPKDLKVLLSVQRRALISVLSAYRTASGESLQVVAGATPIDIVLEEKRAIYNLRLEKDAKMGELALSGQDPYAIKDAKIESISMWQSRWSASTKGRTTFAFFPDIKRRLASDWIRPSHYSTQVLTGHGNFKASLAARKLVDDETCGCGEKDTVEHFLLKCPHFDAQREAVIDITGGGELREVAHQLVSSEEAFSVLRGFADEALWLKSCDGK